MPLTPKVTFRGVERTHVLETEILSRLRKLQTYYPRMTTCRVLVEQVQRHHEAGNRYHVRIDLTLPGEAIAIGHEASLHSTVRDVHAEKLTKVAEPDPERKHVHVAIREAFDIARRRLQDAARRQRGAVKTPARQSRGRVSKLFPVDEFGFIEGHDGREVYFQKSGALKDVFDRLVVGSAVSFVEEQGAKGPQASTVRLLHRRRARRASHARAGASVGR